MMGFRWFYGLLVFAQREFTHFSFADVSAMTVFHAGYAAVCRHLTRDLMSFLYYCWRYCSKDTWTDTLFVFPREATTNSTGLNVSLFIQ